MALAEGGANLNTAESRNNRTALHIAVLEGKEGKRSAEALKALIAAGADVNQKDKRSYTALMYARGDDVEGIKALTVHVKATEERTALAPVAA